MIFGNKKSRESEEDNLDKHERFKRVAARRTQTILEDFRKLGNCSTYNNYEYTKEEVMKIFSAIDESLMKTKAKFDKPKKTVTSEKFEL